MLNKDYTAKLLNLEDVIITDVKNLSNEVHISLQLPRKAHVCPACGAVTARIHDYTHGLSIKAAVELSYLAEEHQILLLDAMDYAQMAPSLAQARRIRAFSDSGKLDANMLEAILSEEKPLERKVTLRNDKLTKYFPSSYTPRQMENIITQLLEVWSRKQKERTDHGR